MESDDEVSGKGNRHTTEFRQYDTRLGRWMSIDPLSEHFQDQSPYAGMANNPIAFNDPNGDCPWCAVFDYAFQVASNYSNADGGISTYDAFIGQVDFLSVGASAIPGGKFFAKAVKVASNFMEFKPNQGPEFKSVSSIVISHASTKYAKDFTSGLKKMSSG